MTVAEAKKLWNHRLGEDALVAELESIAKSDTGMALTIGIDLARLVLDDYWFGRDLEIKAKAYLSAVGLEK